MDVFLVVASTLAVLYTASVAEKVLGGYTLVRETPRYSMRLQVVNASGDQGLGSQAVKDIAVVSDQELAVEVVETIAFDLRRVAGSFVVSRQDDIRAACRLAEKLGLKPGDVEYQPLVNNRQQITATLVLGSDGLNPAPVVSHTEEN